VTVGEIEPETVSGSLINFFSSLFCLTLSEGHGNKECALSFGKLVKLAEGVSSW